MLKIFTTFIWIPTGSSDLSNTNISIFVYILTGKPPGLYPKGLTSAVNSPSMRRDDSSFLLLIYGATNGGTDAVHLLFELVDSAEGHDIGGTVGDDANADERGERCCRDIRISKA